MTPVTRISRLRHPGVLRDFTWPQDLDEFSRFNLIYGWNGSGKTTISRLFRALELRKPPIGEAKLIVNGHTVSGGEFRESALPIRVFNRDFVAESVFPVGGGDVDPIFVVGKESADKQAEAEKLKTEQSNLEQSHRSARVAGDQAAKALDKHCVDQASIIRETLRSAGKNAYNNYDKGRYRQRANQMLKDGDKELNILSNEEREQLLARTRATQKEKIQEIQYQLPDLEQCRENVSQLMGTTVVSSAIESLKEDTELASWTHQGLGIHQARHAENCLFCEQPLPDGRIVDLEAHFSSEYEGLLRKLDGMSAQIKKLLHEASQVQLPNRAELFEDLSNEYHKSQQIFLEHIEKSKEYLQILIDSLARKKEHLFEPVENLAPAPELEGSPADSINSIIRRHNIACDKFESIVDEAREKLEADSIAASLEEYKVLLEKLEATTKSVTDNQKKVRETEVRIAELERDIIEHRQPAEEFNEDLRNYLGHDELRLEVKKTGYIITRNGNKATALSEGEMTAISLLYFLKSLSDRRFELKKGVVVLDDPVSSLDANALFCAFSFIRQRTDQCGQVFILTHNFSFFRQVRNWFYYKNNQLKRYYMIEPEITQNGRRSKIKKLDPMLEKFGSEYHYLFDRLYNHANGVEVGGFEENYVFPNMARRLLETFLAFRQPQHLGELRQKLLKLDFDESRKTRILRFLHTHSHGDKIGEPEHDPSALGETQAVLRDLMALMESEDPRHYFAMVNLVDPPQTEEPSR